jgi:MOB kinase activator 1
MKPFKNIKNVDKTSKYMHLKQIAQMTLGSGNMNLAVELPQG